MRLFTKLKIRLMPYLYQAAIESHERGIPMMRAMCLEFPEDPGCAHLDRQYMLGERLLVAPVFTEEGNVSYYVPAGTWTNFLSSESVEGPNWREERHPYSSLPLLVRPNSVIPVGACEARADYDFPADVTLRAYRIENGALLKVAVPALDGQPGSAFTLSRAGAKITLVPGPATSNWRLLLVGENGVSVTGGTLEATAEGCLVVPESAEATLVVTLQS
jgi:alpha-D-xyloside xylohydrolase